MKVLDETRVARPADAAEIARIHVASWRVTYASLLPEAALRRLSVAALTRKWRVRLATRSSPERIRVASHSGRVTGFVTFGAARDRAEDAGFAGEVTMLYVDPECEGLGIGSALLSSSLEALRAAGHYWAVIWAVEGNAAAIAFYQQHGFALDGGRRIDGFGGGRTPLVRVAKPLGPRIEI